MTERFGPYTLVRRLATGGMAEVFLAVQTSIEGFEREVVIKRILPHRAQDAEFCTMFLDEARLVARLNHPNVAQIYDLGKVDESFYIVMEYVRGPDLARLLDEAAEAQSAGLPDVVAVPVISALCEALHYIHTRTDEFGSHLNIVHRDLNPKNVIVSYDGAVKLIDFGIAKAASQVYETRTGVIKGTYGYMAPEQVTKRRPIDMRADLFSLGVLTYELTTGRHPFDAPDEVAVLSKLVRGTFVPPTKVAADYPPELERIVMSLMALDPDDRPVSARDVLSRIERFAVNQRLPLTMSRIADYVRLQTEPEEPVDQLPAPVEARGEGTAMVSQRLAKRADHETAELATAFLRHGGLEARVGPAPRGASARSRERQVVRGSRPPRDRGRRSGELPWSSWGRRERITAIVAASAVAVAALVSGILVAGALGNDHDLATDPISPEPLVETKTGDGPDDLYGEPIVPGKVSPQTEVGSNYIEVNSTPPGAEILVDGETTGHHTPYTVPVPPGKSRIWIGVRLAGYDPQERQVATSVGLASFTMRPSEESAPPLDEIGGDY